MDNNINKSDDNLDKSISNSDLKDVKSSQKRNHKYLEMLFMGCVTGASVLFGFSSALARAKKKDANAFDKGFLMESESGVSLANRALLRATIYSTSGFGLFCFIVWKAMAVNDMKEFNAKMKSSLNKWFGIKPMESKGRTEFESLRDLLQYVIDESDKSKKQINENQTKND